MVTLTPLFQSESVFVDVVGKRLPVKFSRESFCPFLDHKTPVVCLLAKPLCSLSYGNITLLESDHDIEGYQVSDLIS